jgi:ABC-type bacteriocin/lantibiotic exporter with double-glycine peptidase domain
VRDQKRAEEAGRKKVGRCALRPVVQQDPTGCGMACVAALTGLNYTVVKKAAARLGIAVSDPRLWSETKHLRRLFAHFGITLGKTEAPFTAWDTLPAPALLATKWHREKTGPAWHWVVFARDQKGACVLDSKLTLRSHRRTDFGRIRPKWFIRVIQ